jgi:hypothetical protein
MSDSEKKYVVVVGNMGVGKSYFINNQVHENVRHNSGPDQVTKQSRSYVSRDDGNVMFTDTLGFDKDKIPHSLLVGKRVCFVVILSTVRINEEKAFALKMIGQSPHKFYCKHGAAASEEMPSIDDFELSQLPEFLVNPAYGTGLQNNLQGGPQQPTMMANSLFKKHSNLPNELKVRLKNAYQNAPLQIVNQEVITENDLLAVDTQQMLSRYRQRGESILKYMLQCMEYEPEMVESLIGNERLAGFVESWGLRPHFNSLYTGDNNDFTAETIADYIEALFGFVYANDKRKVVSLIVKIISN